MRIAGEVSLKLNHPKIATFSLILCTKVQNANNLKVIYKRKCFTLFA